VIACDWLKDAEIIECRILVVGHAYWDRNGLR